MGFPAKCLLVSLIATVLCLHGASAACREAWSRLGESCYGPVAMTTTDQPSAVSACGRQNARLPLLPSNESALSLQRHLEGRGINVTSLWLPHRLLRLNASHAVVVDARNESTASCEECTRLSRELASQSGNEFCITVGSAGWKLANCSQPSSYVCQADIVEPETDDFLDSREILAIFCGIFLIVSIVAVFVLDVVKNPGKNDQLELMRE